MTKIVRSGMTKNVSLVKCFVYNSLASRESRQGRNESRTMDETSNARTFWVSLKSPDKGEGKRIYERGQGTRNSAALDAGL